MEIIRNVAHGFGFMLGMLACYTVYDCLFTLAVRRAEKAQSAKRRRRRKN